MLIRCPYCGDRDHAEFAYAGDASLRRPAADAPFHAWHDYVHLRDNPRGPHRELWQHVYGCRAFVIVERNTANHLTSSSSLAGTSGPES
jgi:heterotetrameric sarcosine oxidase delta subunit